MLFEALEIEGCYLIDLQPHRDERGFFARTFCKEEFRSKGLACEFVQCSTSHSNRRGTLRGLHFQIAPHQEVKLVRCTKGAIYDVILDLRKDSKTYLQHLKFELTESNHRALYVAEGLAHGFQTLADETEVFYQMSCPYAAQAASGVRWNDPAFGISWPILPPILSERDDTLADFTR